MGSLVDIDAEMAAMAIEGNNVAQDTDNEGREQVRLKVTDARKSQTAGTCITSMESSDECDLVEDPGMVPDGLNRAQTSPDLKAKASNPKKKRRFNRRKFGKNLKKQRKNLRKNRGKRLRKSRKAKAK